MNRVIKMEITIISILFVCACSPSESAIQTAIALTQSVQPLEVNQSPIPPTLTNTPLAPTDTSIPTNTPLPSPILTPRQTNTPAPPRVSDGEIFYQWARDNNTSPYLVWGAQLREIMNNNCQGFICEGKDLRVYDSEVWQFLGRGEYGKMVFAFDKPLDTFVLTFMGNIGIDAISGITIDGNTVTYGYLVNGEKTASYMDSSGFPMDTIITAENKQIPVAEPCGIIDPNPDGDNNFNVSLWRGAIVWNFLDLPFNSAWTRKGYSLIELIVVAQSSSNITSDQICP